MLTIAVPALDMRTWPQDESRQSQDLTTRRAFDLVTAEYGPGANGVITVVVDRSPGRCRRGRRDRRTLHDDADIVGVTAPVDSPDGAVAVLEAQPAFGPSDARMPGLVDRPARRAAARHRGDRDDAPVRRHHRAARRSGCGW